MMEQESDFWLTFTFEKMSLLLKQPNVLCNLVFQLPILRICSYLGTYSAPECFFSSVSDGLN